MPSPTARPAAVATAAPLPGTGSLASRVRAELENRILAGRLLPGERLVEEEIAEQARVSRGPVREAFRALEQAGLVRTEKNRGVFVREIRLEDADEIYEVRAGLDELIGRLAAERLTAAGLAELRALLARMEVAARTEDVDAYYPLNVAFHELLAGCTGNRSLLASYRILVNQLHLYRRETLARGAGSFATSTREHSQIVDALAGGDGMLAGRLLFDHAMESRERLYSALHADVAERPAVVPGRSR